jgi:phosphatidylglycerophosphate synthase
MFSEKLGHKLDIPLSSLIKKSWLARTNPNILTLTGFFINFIAAAAIVCSYWKTASLLILTAGLFDILDGATARTMKRNSYFGEFLDSVVDRYSDMVILFAFIIYYSLNTDLFMISLASVTTIGIVLIPYARAKAERFLKQCNIGILERPERIIIISAGCYFNIMKPVFLILAILAHITVLQRIYYTWHKTKKLTNTENKL